jgi:hypothetical protein
VVSATCGQRHIISIKFYHIGKVFIAQAHNYNAEWQILGRYFLDGFDCLIHIMNFSIS